MIRVRTDEFVTDADADELWPVYASVFDDHPDCPTWREAVWDKHCARAGFRLARAHDSDALVGFAYGYTGESGQWWTDNARRALDPAVADAWLGGHFELVSIGVLDTARGRGLGRRLLRELCTGSATTGCC
jgi:ribosomal protein S18 acetylase RimI-like enzyme